MDLYSIITTTLWIIIALGGCGLGYFVWILMKYKHKVRIRVKTKDRHFVIDDKAREVKIKDVMVWKLLKRKHIITIPPPESIELTKKGKMIAECYYSEAGYYNWAKNDVPMETVFRDNPPRPLLQEGRDRGSYVWITDTTKNIDSKHVITQNQRGIYAMLMRDAEERKMRHWTEHLPQIAGFTMMFLVFVMVLIFWKDVTAPSVAVAARLDHTSEQLDGVSNKLNDIILGNQVIKEEGTGVPDDLPPTPPPS